MSFLSSLTNLFLHERERWGLWLPVLLGLGVWGYFACSVEPSLGWLGVAPVLLGLFWWRRWLPLLILLVLALGFNAAQFAAWRAMTPMLQNARYVPELSGRLVAVDPAANGATLHLDQLSLPSLPPEQLPQQIRLKIREAAETLPTVGSRIALAAQLTPISEPAAPSAYDFRRQAFFNGIGAQGFVRGGVRVLAPPAADSGLLLWVEGLRAEIAARVAARLSGDTAQIAVALLNGAQSGISAGALQQMRASGLYHILSISGLHLAIVAAFVYVGTRRLLALSPLLALRWPIKKIAAGLALFALIPYTLLVGEPVPAVRSALMTGLVLLAVLVERRALSLRSVALAATLLLLVVPQAMLGASFQMSFAAVTVMVAGYEAVRRHRVPALGKAAVRGWVGNALHGIWRHGGGMLLTSLLASIATTPFTLYQFQQANGYGLFANLLGIPLTSFVIMPAGFLAYFLMPFGAEGWALQAMGWGIEQLLALAAFVGDWPGATLRIAAFPATAFALMLLGGLWLVIWQRRWRLLGLLPLALGILWACCSPRPDLYLAAEGKALAIRQTNGSWLVQRTGGESFTIKQWQQREGGADFMAADKVAETEAFRCDPLGCLYQQDGKRIALIQDTAALVEDCGAVDVIISPLWHIACPQTRVIDGAWLKLRGATTVTLHHDGTPPEITSTRSRWGARPWSPGWKNHSVGETIIAPATQTIPPQIEEQ